MFFLLVNIKKKGVIIIVVQKRYILLYKNIGIVAYKKKLYKKKAVVQNKLKNSIFYINKKILNKKRYK